MIYNTALSSMDVFFVALCLIEIHSDLIYYA